MEEKEYLETLREKIRETKELEDFLYDLEGIAELNLPSGIYCEWDFDLNKEAFYLYEKEEGTLEILKVEFICYISTLCWHYFIAKDFEEVKNGLQNLPKLPGPAVAFLIDGRTSLFEAATKIDFSDFLKNN
jgi:hypothetical protein